MRKIWQFFSKPQNLAILVALAGGLGFLWTQVIAPILSTPDGPSVVSPEPKVAPAPIHQNAQAGSGGLAINATGEAKVTTNQNNGDKK